MNIEPSIVRIRTPDGRTVGAGFLVADRQVLTCAHVVAAALGLPEGTPETPQAEVHLDFPLVTAGSILTARIIHWQPESDVAGLQLDGDPPVEARPVRLVTAKDLWAHAFRAFGFPTGCDDGVWASGVLRGRQAAGWVQIEDVKEPGYWVQPGFSGTAVWDEQLNGVAGMAVAADTDRGIKAAFMIPASLLIEAWPQLGQGSLDAGSLVYLREQLAMLEAAQQEATDPRRFQARIDELQAAIANWDGRVETQRQRIADGLEAQRQQVAVQQRDEMRLHVVGRRPLDVADYFKDRERELVTIGQLLAEPTTRLVSIIGHGGMGKTALACKVLRDLERHRWPHTQPPLRRFSQPSQGFPPLDGIVYLSTRTAGISLERLFLDCARVLGGEQEKRLNALWTNPQIGTEEKVSYLLEALSEGRYVILLDNLEDVLDDEGQLLDEDLRLFLEHSLTTSYGAQLLVTSRLALAFRREVMCFDRQVKLLEGLPIADGVALLRELDPNGDYGLQDAPEEGLAQAVSLVHGVPRALEVLAGILANDPFASLADVLEQFYEQEDVVQALIEENYKRLDGDARRVIKALAVFRRPVPPLAVDYLLEPFAPGLDVPGIIRRLTRANIVSVDRAAKTVTLHPIDQDYAYSQLPEEGTGERAYTRQALGRRAADYYVQLRTPPETWKTIDDLEPQLAEFEHRVRAGDYDDACQVLEPIDSNYLYRWGQFAKLIELREELLGRLGSLQLHAVNLGSLGNVYRDLGQVKQAIEHLQQALTIVHKAGDSSRESTYLGYLGRTYRSVGQHDKAIECLQRALALARDSRHRSLEHDRQLPVIAGQATDQDQEDIWLIELGLVHRDLVQHDQAIDYFKQALAIARKRGDRFDEQEALGNLGISYRQLGQHRLAVEYLQRAFIIASRMLKDKRREGIWLINLGDAFLGLGKHTQAISHYQQGLTIAQGIGAQCDEGYCLVGLGKAYSMLGRFDTFEVLSLALKISIETGIRELEQSCRVTLARVHLDQGQFLKALDAIPTSLQYGKYMHLACVLRGLIFLRLDQEEMARNAFEEALSHANELLSQTMQYYVAKYTRGLALSGLAMLAADDERGVFVMEAQSAYRTALESCNAAGVIVDAQRLFSELQRSDQSGVLEQVKAIFPTKCIDHSQ